MPKPTESAGVGDRVVLGSRVGLGIRVGKKTVGVGCTGVALGEGVGRVSSPMQLAIPTALASKTNAQYFGTMVGLKEYRFMTG